MGERWRLSAGWIGKCPASKGDGSLNTRSRSERDGG
jgi:hypothetical protein